MTSYENLYKGSESILMPKYVSAGYDSGITSLGMSLDPRTANQLGEINTKINPGIKHIEITTINPEILDSIPTQHFEEIRRLSKLTGVSTSLHAPIVEASGIGQRSGWEESNRLGAERQIANALLRAHDLDPKGNVSVTTHTTAGLPELTTRIKEGKEEKIKGMYYIDVESGKIGSLQEQKRYLQEGQKEFTGEPARFEPKKELEKLNKDAWVSQLNEINRQASFGENSLENIKKQSGFSDEIIKELIQAKNIDELDIKADREILESFQKELNHGQIYLRESYRNMKNLFDKAYQKSDEEDKKVLQKFAKEITPMIKKDIENPENIQELNKVVERGLKVLGSIKNPVIFQPLQEFTIEQTAKTFGNAATKAFNKYGDSAPILNIENPPAGSGLSRAEDLKKVIEESRKVVVENLKKEGMSAGEAKQAAEKLIGATWDVGHINMIRKLGYEEADVVKETKIIAPFVKHVHLSDNFGLEHTELPMGMGNVPLKKIMEKLGEKGFEGKKIIEAGNWWQYFADKGGGNPFKPTIEAFNSPIYQMSGSQYWSTPPAMGAYYSGHGPINTPTHHRLYGAGFENLPIELGGEIQGDRGRFSGAPNA